MELLEEYHLLVDKCLAVSSKAERVHVITAKYATHEEKIKLLRELEQAQ